jgi:hypothetical protein
MSNAKNQHDQEIVCDFANEPVRAYSIFPKFPEAGAVQSLSEAARIVQLGDSFMKEPQNALTVLRVELTELPVSLER